MRGKDGGGITEAMTTKSREGRKGVEKKGSGCHTGR